MKLFLVGFLGLLVGALLSGIFVSYLHEKSSNERMSHAKSVAEDQKDEHMTMDMMVDSLKNKSDDEFDKAFITGMIEHHQGAIDMAKLAQKQAKHEELKTMAENIISSQSTEILQMQQWQKEWNY